MTRPLLGLALWGSLLIPRAALGQASVLPGTLVIAVAREAISPVPTLWASDHPSQEVSDLLFLHLADLGPTLSTTDESSFVPRLARRWTRRDPQTLIFELDPRAQWQDGVPVTARDVVFALERARNPNLSPQLAALLGRIDRVTARDNHRVEIHYRLAYAEQLYDAVFHAPPLPAHLLTGVAPESLATAPFRSRPVGNGPYSITRWEPGKILELTANPAFFLGKPGIHRVVFLPSPDPETRVNLMLAGEVDAVENLYSLPNWHRVEALPAFHYYPVPGLGVVYSVFNQRDPADTSRPHPIFTDPVVRQALVQLLDREVLSRAAYGNLTEVPDAPVSAVLGRAITLPPHLAVDTSLSRRHLAASGWLDHDEDGVLDKNGRPLAFALMVPSVSASRMAMAATMQEAWRRAGVRVQVEPVEPPVYVERRNAGRFDLDLYSVIQDPTPSGLAQSWSCAGIGGSNAGYFCDPVVDTLLAQAGRSLTASHRLYQDAVRRLAEDVPAIFLAAPVNSVPVHRRFANVVLRPESFWAAVWQWRILPGAELERDRR